ncbi:hypothetical protein JTE90_026132 [Oedothorax gibbosus]|uniref:Uncharacterized protein n=1 Tax=Oedothorax gibbosus TaxID=931172 RepID=A0AAV6UZQ8_9ARAC|nr:hypothetical protein JTE90_026132 [Oedothorax gibbosus]
MRFEFALDFIEVSPRVCLVSFSPPVFLKKTDTARIISCQTFIVGCVTFAHKNLDRRIFCEDSPADKIGGKVWIIGRRGRTVSDKAFPTVCPGNLLVSTKQKHTLTLLLD